MKKQSNFFQKKGVTIHSPLFNNLITKHFCSPTVQLAGFLILWVCTLLPFASMGQIHDLDLNKYCDEGTSLAPGTAVQTLCQQNSGFVADVEIGTTVEVNGVPVHNQGGVVFVSQLANQPPSHPTYGQAWVNKKILIWGTLVIDENTGFENCTVQLEVGAVIRTDGNSTIFSNGSSFFCCNDMWKGIQVVHPGGGASIKNSKFEDAVTAFTIDDGTYAYFYKNRFNRNNVGIRNGDAVSGQAGLVFSNFKGNTFDCDADLNTTSAGGFGKRSFAGIQLNNCTATIGAGLGLTNTFKRLQHGVYAKGSDVVSVHNLFEGMLPEASASGEDVGGIGISTQDGHLTVREIMTTANGTPVGPPKFNNCGYAGIQARGTSMDARNSQFLGTYEIGITSDENDIGEEVKISKNTFNLTTEDDNSHYLVHLIRSNASGILPHCSVTGNTMEIGGDSDSDNVGIFVGSGSGFAIDQIEVKENMISVNNPNPNNIGIWAAPSDNNFRILYNVVDFEEGSGTDAFRYGVFVENGAGFGHQLSNNFINDGEDVSGNSATSCIHLKRSENWTICNNTLNHSLKGLWFRGDCDPATVKGNNILAHDRGLLIENDGGSPGAIDVQLRHSNSWSTVASDYTQFAAQCTSNPNFSQFIVENNSLEKFPTDIAPVDGWFVVEAGSVSSCSVAGLGAALSGLDKKLIADVPTSPESWSSKKQLVYKLLQYPELRPTGTDAATFFTNQLETVPGKLAQVDYRLQVATQMPLEAQEDLDLLQTRRLAFMDEVVDLENTWTADSLEYSPALITAKRSLFDSIEVLRLATKAIEAQVWQERLLRLDTVESYNQGIPTTAGTFEHYQKQLNQLRIKLARGLELTEADFDTALAIATATYGTGDPTEMLSNSFLPPCDVVNTFRSSGSGLGKQAPEQSEAIGIDYTLTPNPAKELVELQFTAPYTGMVEILDMAGRTVIWQAVNGASVARLNTAPLRAGVYFVSLKGGGKAQLPVRKLVIGQ